MREIELEKVLKKTILTLVTFFAIRGPNFQFLKDETGDYYIDPYGHQVYQSDHGKVVHHTTCDGENIQVSEIDKYYYDEIGRYVLNDKGEKEYQVAPCTSKYKMNDVTTLLEKSTKDCGHSENVRSTCKVAIKGPDKPVLLPANDSIDIRKSLTPEVAKYIWDAVGYILPDALVDVGLKQPSNPIYYLANRLIYHKYHKNNTKQLKDKKKDAEKFRAEIYKRRKEEAEASLLASKAKGMKKIKPEEFDNIQDHIFLAMQLTAQQQAAQHQAAQQQAYYFD